MKKSLIPLPDCGQKRHPKLSRLIVVLLAAMGLLSSSPRGHAASASADSNLTTVDTTTGPVTIEGVVVDSSGRVVPSALVVATFAGVSRNGTTDSSGRYALSGQARGVYLLAAFKIGYASDARLVSIGPATVRQDFRLNHPVAAPETKAANPGEDTPPASEGGGGAGKAGRLLRFDGKAFAEGVPDRDLPTVVLTHGWVRCVEATADRTTNAINDWPLRFAHAAHRANLTPNRANILGWDWYEAARPCELGGATLPPEGITPNQGVALGRAVYEALGASYSKPIHFVGHSLGTLVNSYAVDYVHGTSRSGDEDAVAKPKWDASRTQVTLLDDAEMGKLVANESLVAGLIGGVEGGLEGGVASAVPSAVAAYFREGSKWKDPVPSEFGFMDTYFACVGRYRAGAVNVLLQQPIWNPAVNPAVSSLELGNKILKAHSVPPAWYIDTIDRTNMVVGWPASLGGRMVLGRPTPPAFDEDDLRSGSLWRQPWTGDEFEVVEGNFLEGVLPPFLVGVNLYALRSPDPLGDAAAALANAVILGSMVVATSEGLIDWLEEQASETTAWAAGQARKLGKTTVEVVEDAAIAAASGMSWAVSQVQSSAGAVLDLPNRRGLRIGLTTSAPLGGPQLTSAVRDGNTPAYLWLPVNVPASAQWMSFQFRIEGDGRDDVLVMGIGETSRFSLGTRFISRDTVERSGPIHVADWAGRRAEFFFGIVGGTSTNCTVTVSDVEFRSFAVPSLEVQRDGLQVILSWPSSSPNWRLEASDAAAGDPDWQPVGIQPSLLAGKLRVSVPVVDQVQFFRLGSRP